MKRGIKGREEEKFYGLGWEQGLTRNMWRKSDETNTVGEGSGPVLPSPIESSGPNKFRTCKVSLRTEVLIGNQSRTLNWRLENFIRRSILRKTYGLRNLVRHVYLNRTATLNTTSEKKKKIHPPPTLESSTPVNSPDITTRGYCWDLWFRVHSERPTVVTRTQQYVTTTLLICVGVLWGTPPLVFLERGPKKTWRFVHGRGKGND